MPKDSPASPAQAASFAGDGMFDPLHHVVAGFGLGPQPSSTFRAFDEAVERSVGRLFLTIFRLTPEHMSERIFTTDPEAFPVGHMKPLPQGGRAAALYREKKPFLAFGLAAIRAEYEGHAKVIALGAEAMANFPIVYNGAMIGAVNIGGRGWRDQGETEALVAPLVTALGPVVVLMPFPATRS
jgi:hypothetical protein